MKKLSVKAIAGIIIGAVLVIAAAAVILVMTLRIDQSRAREIALEQTGGGEIIQEEVSSEGLVSEFSYVITNGDNWYEIEIGGFGNVGEMKSGTGQYIDD